MNQIGGGTTNGGRRKMAAAAGQRQRKRVVVVMKDKRDDYIVYNVGISHLFLPGAGAGSGGTETRRLPSPVGQIDKPFAHPESLDFALAADGATLVGVSSLKRTVLYDTRSGALTAGPELQYSKSGGTHVIPLGPRLYALESRLTAFEQGNPTGEDCALFRRSSSSSSWRALPEPPPDFRCLSHFQIRCDLAAYFTAGARIWVSAADRGTYTFDTVSRAWRKEGDWELPFHGRALVVPDMDNLCFGLCTKTRHLVAVDIRKSPQLIVYRWEETFPSWLLPGRTNKACALFPQGSLVYLGDGRFCIVWSGFMDDAHGHREHFVQFIAVQIVKTSTASGNKKLRMVKLKACCYKMPTDGRIARAF